MKACANPKCRHHITVDPRVFATGVLNYSEPAGGSGYKAKEVIKFTNLHPYYMSGLQNEPSFFLCDICHGAAQVVLRNINVN